ncbi:MAG: class I SAM-dependent methyltransferase [Mariprofundaceae bacterium]|nr:class I SAM-dependent methyltransferase [Mariprofundaceae bacterium]
MSEQRSAASDKGINPLGHASPDRYVQGAWPRALLSRMAHWVSEIHSQGELLDIGCGEGALLHAVGMEGIGVDLNSERLILAAERGLSVALANGEQLPFADASFETVVSMEVLEHVPDMNGMIREIKRVLKPGGHWLISVPSVTLRSWYEMSREHRPYYCDADEHYREFSSANLPWFEHRFVSTKEFEKQLQAGGFGLQYRDGVRYLFPQWFSRFPALQRMIESERSDRLWRQLPGVRKFPYWMIRVLRSMDKE